MSTGISISSINRIKELAEEKKYAEALEILDTQNLDKSINPQFLKISGEIFRENKRFYDSRRILLKAHEMAPQGTRIIAELIQLHLTLGHFELAKKYYEEYKFYASEEDTQKEFVEYIMKKATGNDIKELASIIIPILERVPEDKWNFEAVLLYDKLDRKDKALEEAQYILENFKDSVYIKQVIEYIDDKLDVDKCFYIYPKEAVDDDPEIFSDLIEREAKLLEKDHLMMYPPEPRIMVMEDDNDAPEVKPNNKDKSNKDKSNKEKSNKKKRFKKNETESKEVDDKESDDKKVTDESKEKIAADDESKASGDSNKEAVEKDNHNKDKDKSNKEKQEKKSEEKEEESPQSSDNNTDEVELKVVNIEEEIKKEREAALERLLAKRLDKEAIKESAKQMAKAVNLDTDKAKEQVKNVTGSVKDNVKKATETIGEVVGTNKMQNSISDYSEEFVDGIIESVIEAPKKSVGQVVTNEELDSLVPDSLEAMSADEVAEITSKKEEQERIELEALEASLKLEEEKKNKKKKSKSDEAEDDKGQQSENSNSDIDDVITVVSDYEMDATNIESSQESIASVSFAELKAQFLADDDKEEDEEPLDSLGFISVVQSDVDARMEDETPEAAEILHRMIDNKEYYSGEDSRGFESKASYENHGFEVEDIGFNEYIDSVNDNVVEHNRDVSVEYKVDDIFIKENILDFDEISPEDEHKNATQPQNDTKLVEETPIEEDLEENPEENLIEETPIEEDLEENLEENPEENPEEDLIEETPIEDTSNELDYDGFINPEEEVIIVDESLLNEVKEDIDQELNEDFTDEYDDITFRDRIRISIVLTDDMVNGLLELKESR